MADTPDTPAPSADEAKPAPRRRASPRKTAGATAAKPRATRGRKGVVAQAEDSAAKAATAVKDGVAGAADKVAKAVKPRSSSRAKPAATTRPTDKTGAKRTVTRKAATKSTLDKATDKVGGAWGAAGILGGVAAAGVAAAALLTLRGSSGKNLGTPKKPIDISGSGDLGQGHPQTVQGGAHQPDGTDSSASFRAGIADENTIPNKA